MQNKIERFKVLPNAYYKTHILFCVLLIFDIFLLIFMIEQTSIYIKEAEGFFLDSRFCYHLANFGVACINFLFQDPLLNDYGLRLPFVFIHIINCVLIYNISLLVLRKANDALLCAVLFMMIPGVSIEALIVSNVGIITFIALLLIFYQIKYNKILYTPLVVIVFLDSGGAILCLALFFYALLHRKTRTLLFAIVCFGINMSIFSPIHGVPQSYFLDTIGFLSLLFSPALFIYYVAVLYFYTFHNKSSLLNLIPFIGFIFILLLSTRQQIKIESFLPPLSVGLPIFVQKILFDIRCRLPQFRWRYYVRVWIVLLFLLLGNLGLFGNKLTYLVTHERNYAYSFYEAKEIARELHKRKITYIEIPNQKLKLRLKFYGINATSQGIPPVYMLRESNNGSIKIMYFGTIVSQYQIVKNNFYGNMK